MYIPQASQYTNCEAGSLPDKVPVTLPPCIRDGNFGAQGPSQGSVSFLVWSTPSQVPRVPFAHDLGAAFSPSYPPGVPLLLPLGCCHIPRPTALRVGQLNALEFWGLLERQTRTSRISRSTRLYPNVPRVLAQFMSRCDARDDHRCHGSFAAC